jgi:hypothetical protein
VSSVLSSSRAIRVRARAVGFASRECPEIQDWKSYDQDKPYACGLVPMIAGLSDHGIIRMADVSVDQRQLLYNDIISSVKDLEESKRSEALSQLGGSFDIRTGVLALQVLAVVKPTCHAAFCIPELASATDPFEKFAAANKHLIIDERGQGARSSDQVEGRAGGERRSIHS